MGERRAALAKLSFVLAQLPSEGASRQAAVGVSIRS